MKKVLITCDRCRAAITSASPGYQLTLTGGADPDTGLPVALEGPGSPESRRVDLCGPCVHELNVFLAGDRT